jgi:hypothetical protein
MSNNVVQLFGDVGDNPKIFISRSGVIPAVIRVATHDQIKYVVDKTF